MSPVRCPLSAVPCPLSTVRCPLSVVCRLSAAVRSPLSAVPCPLSADCPQLSVVCLSVCLLTPVYGDAHCLQNRISREALTAGTLACGDGLEPCFVCRRSAGGAFVMSSVAGRDGTRTAQFVPAVTTVTGEVLSFLRLSASVLSTTGAGRPDTVDAFPPIQ